MFCKWLTALKIVLQFYSTLFTTKDFIGTGLLEELVLLLCRYKSDGSTNYLLWK